MHSKYSQCLRNQGCLNLYISYLVIKKKHNETESVLHCVYVSLLKNNNLEQHISDNAGVNWHLILSPRPYIDALRNDLQVLSPALVPPWRIPPFHTSLWVMDLEIFIQSFWYGLSMLCVMWWNMVFLHIIRVLCPETRGLNRQIIAFISQWSKCKKNSWNPLFLDFHF